MELFLVFSLDVTLEVTGLGECFIAVKTTVRLLVQMDSIDVNLEVSGLGECFIAIRTTVRPFVQMDSIDVPLEVAGPGEFLRTMLAMERPLLGVGPDVTFEVKRPGPYFLTILTDLVPFSSHRIIIIYFLSLRKTSVLVIVINVLSVLYLGSPRLLLLLTQSPIRVVVFEPVVIVVIVVEVVMVG